MSDKPTVEQLEGLLRDIAETVQPRNDEDSWSHTFMINAVRQLFYGEYERTGYVPPARKEQT